MTRRRTGTGALLWTGLILLATLFGSAPASASTSYFNAPIHLGKSPFTFGQAPVFMPNGRVLASDDFGNTPYNNQTYEARLDGRDQRCLTCQLGGENLVPAVRPQGDWILFHSWLGHHITFGAPGYGGIGSELFAMRSNGTDATKLYAKPSVQDGEGTDDYHAYWSPDGRRIVWTHFNGNIIDGKGQGRWDVRVASFRVRHGKPELTNVRVVRPANGHWYETQWWAPDGSGFLYTESYGTSIDTELFYCHLPKSGACHSTQLTDYPAWNEQALFTPDMKDVIFMSSRAHPGFLNTYIQLAREAGLTSAYDNFLILPIFELGYLQPVAGEGTDLYEESLRTHAIRRLTFDGNQGWVTPEFTWNPSNRKLFWTENRLPPGVSVPLPLNALLQVRNTFEYLTHPQTNPRALSTGNLTNTFLPVQQQTRTLTFPGTCAPPARLRLGLPHRRHARVTRVRVSVGSRVVLRRRGHALRRVSFARPPEAQSFSVSLIAAQSRGRPLRANYRYSGMGCYRSVARRRLSRTG